MGVKKSRGFTLIEMILVIAVIGMVFPLLINILLTVVRQQAKIVALQEIKNQGDSVMNSIETVIRSQAVGIYPAYPFIEINQKCNTTGAIYSSSTGGNDFYFKDKNGKQFQYILNSTNNIASSGAFVAANSKLTNSRVIVSGFSISCTRSASYSGPIVALSFTVSHKEGSSMKFNTRIKLRNY